MGFLKGHKTNVGRKHSEETKQRISLKNTGKPATVGSFQVGHTPIEGSGNKKGYQTSEETKEKISKTHLARWDKIGRKSKRYKHNSNNRAYKLWRISVFERDGYTCQECKVKGIYLEAHHIKSWAHYPEERYNINNGQALCKDCHQLTDNYRGKNRKEVYVN